MERYLLAGCWDTGRYYLFLSDLQTFRLRVAMVGGLWLALPDTPDKDIGLSYFGVVSPYSDEPHDLRLSELR